MRIGAVIPDLEVFALNERLVLVDLADVRFPEVLGSVNGHLRHPGPGPSEDEMLDPDFDVLACVSERMMVALAPDAWEFENHLRTFSPIGAWEFIERCRAHGFDPTTSDMYLGLQLVLAVLDVAADPNLDDGVEWSQPASFDPPAIAVPMWTPTPT